MSIQNNIGMSSCPSGPTGPKGIAIATADLVRALTNDELNEANEMLKNLNEEDLSQLAQSLSKSEKSSLPSSEKYAAMLWVSIDKNYEALAKLILILSPSSVTKSANTDLLDRESSIRNTNGSTPLHRAVSKACKDPQDNMLDLILRNRDYLHNSGNDYNITPLEMITRTTSDVEIRKRIQTRLLKAMPTAALTKIVRPDPLPQMLLNRSKDHVVPAQSELDSRNLRAVLIECSIQNGASASEPHPLKRLTTHPLYEPLLLNIVKDFLVPPET